MTWEHISAPLTRAIRTAAAKMSQAVNDNPDEDCGLPVIGRCKACGRGFVILPDRKPWIDDYAPDMTDDPERVCGGEIELTREGRAAFARGPQLVTD